MIFVRTNPNLALLQEDEGDGGWVKRKARAGGTGEMVKSSSQKKEMDFMSAMWMIRIGKCHIASVLFAQQSA